jgi:adenylate cyclase
MSARGDQARTSLPGACRSARVMVELRQPILEPRGPARAMASTTRRLAAILATDVAGYSRLMGADEEGTHERLKAHLRELVEPKISEHRGRIVKNTGDGFLAEFPSVVDAVRCAVETQRGMLDREPAVSEEQRIRFRVGINLGDVIVEPHDIFGDGVNVAARLEALAEPGGICVSRVVRDQVRDRLDYAFEDMGEQQVKNIDRAVRVYALRPEAIALLPAPNTPAAPPASQPVIAPRLSIVVLPFSNLSDDREQQYFADCITEDVTTDLSRLPDMLVISRNTAFTYQGKRVDTKQIGRELGVRYVLEGSVQRSGNRVRTNAQLIDAETDKHLWVDRFSGDASDLFTLQDEITGRLANMLGVELIAAETARPTEHPHALDYILRGRAALLKPRTLHTLKEAINLFDHALALDPQSVGAQSGLANALVSRVLDGITMSRSADLARAEELVDQVLATAPRYASARATKGDTLRARMRCEEAIPQYETALSLNPNLASVLHALGGCKLTIGLIGEVVPIEEQAIRLSPRDPNIGNWYWRIGMVHLLQSRTEEAIAWFERARSANPEASSFHSALASAYGLRGETERAAAELAEARRLDVDRRFSRIAHLKAVPGTWWGTLKTRALAEATYFAGLRKAGVPEE